MSVNSFTQSEFADHLKVGRPYVTALKKAGRLVLDAHGKVLVKESIDRIAATARGAQSTVPETPTTSTARETLDTYKAAHAQLDFEERCGRLTKGDEVDAAAANAGILIRKRIEGVVDLAAILAAKTSEDECRAVLHNWAQEVLQEQSAQYAAIASKARAASMSAAEQQRQIKADITEAAA
jgi:hypothetical protein